MIPFAICHDHLLFIKLVTSIYRILQYIEDGIGQSPIRTGFSSSIEFNSVNSDMVI